MKYVRRFVYIPLSCERWEKLGKGARGLEYEILGSMSFYLVEWQSALKSKRELSLESPFELAASGKTGNEVIFKQSGVPRGRSMLSIDLFP